MKRFAAIFLLHLYYFGNAQDPYSINYSLNEGLQSTNIYSVFQEENGMIWFTTDVGVVKYNSKKFELFSTDNGLSDNEVFKLNKDSKGRIWMHTMNGKPSFILNGQFFNESNSALLKKIRGNGFLSDFYEDEGKNIYLTFKNGELYKISERDSVKKYNTKKAVFGVWKNDDTYLITPSGLLNTGNNKEILFDFIHSPVRVYHGNKKTFISARNVLLTPNGHSISEVERFDNSIDIINVVEEADNLWICTRSGLLQYKNGQVKNIYFKDYIVSDILKDFEGNYWITTLNKGVLFVPSFQVPQVLKEKQVFCLGSNYHNELWIGGYENDYYVKDNKGISGNMLNPAWLKNKISRIRFFGDSTYIIGKSGLKIINKTKSTECKINLNDIAENNGYKFIATSFAARIKNSAFNNYSLANIQKHILLNKRTNVLCNDFSGNTWMGTNFGLHQYNTDNIIRDFGDIYADLSVSIDDLYYDTANGLLLVATASNGLVILKNSRFFKKFNTLNGLNSNTIHSICNIGKNTYLIGSNNGLNKVFFSDDLNNTTVNNLNPYIGIKNRRIMDIEYTSDTIYLATDYGVLYFNSGHIVNKHIHPKCIILGLKNQLDNNTRIIDYRKNSVNISYCGISFLDLGDVNYYYKLEDQDRGWSVTKETQINYRSLPARPYTFYVYCINSFGEKSEIQKISFEILPPFWQKPWFIYTTAGLGILSFVGLIKRRFKKQREKFEIEKNQIQIERDRAMLEKKMVELEQKALRLQMNPHFIFNALNTIKGYYSEKNFPGANNYISKFSKLLRKLLENEEQVTTLDSEIEMLELYLELTQIRYHDKFEFTVSVAPDLVTSEILIPNLLLQPLVENAIVHGLNPMEEKGKLVIDFSAENNWLSCMVKDNGIGRNAAMNKQVRKEYHSKAIDIIKERLTLFDVRSKMEYTDLYIDNIPAGTKVVITIPVKKTFSV